MMTMSRQLRLCFLVLSRWFATRLKSLSNLAFRCFAKLSRSADFSGIRQRTLASELSDESTYSKKSAFLLQGRVYASKSTICAGLEGSRLLDVAMEDCA